jgi:hypothetical protein
MRGADDPARVIRTGPRSFSVDFGGNTIVQRLIPSTFQFRISGQTPTSYNIAFTDAVDRALVLYLSEGRLQVAGMLDGNAAPFGVVDLPAPAAVCDGESLRFAGWALSLAGIERVALEREDGSRVGDAVLRPGMRPDVMTEYAAFPDVDRAGWDFELPCADVRKAEGGELKVAAIAYDRRGVRRVIGERTVKIR